MKLVYTASARQDILAIINWYNDYESYLGERFDSERLELVDKLKMFPEMAPDIGNNLRRATFSTFPYSLFYRLTSDTIFVLSILHTSRDPDTWNNR
jgi:toxin ParE1/3/4